MERFTRIVGLVVFVAAAITALLGIFFQQYDAVEMFLFAVALAVSAIPEGLHVGITVALGVASRRMANVGVIVRRLVAVEWLGSCTMIASDKTGTLTANELTVKQVQITEGSTFEVTGEGYPPEGNLLQDGHPSKPDLADELSRLARASVLCNGATCLGGTTSGRGAVTRPTLPSSPSVASSGGPASPHSMHIHKLTRSPSNPNSAMRRRSTGETTRRGYSSRAHPSACWRCVRIRVRVNFHSQPSSSGHTR
jgi:hypothetical protein